MFELLLLERPRKPPAAEEAMLEYRCYRKDLDDVRYRSGSGRLTVGLIDKSSNAQNFAVMVSKADPWKGRMMAGSGRGESRVFTSDQR